MIVQTKDRDLVRSVDSMALLNTNKDSLNKYKEEKQKAIEMKQLRDEVKELKSLILQMVNKNG